MSRDFQKQRVYDWENRIVAPYQKVSYAFSDLPRVVAGVWMASGLMYPPKVSAMPKQARRIFATGCRTELRFPEDRPSPDRIVLHEIAHALGGTFDGDNDAHGPDYVWLYMELLERHLSVPMPLLMFTAQRDGVKFNIGAKPRFVEA